jgi:hypothetical protein
MIPRVLAVLTIGLLALGAGVQALLLGHLLLLSAPSDLAPAWPSLLTRAAHLALWPVARLAGQSPDSAHPVVVLAAMALYLIVMIGGIAMASLAARMDQARHPWRPPLIEQG